MKTSKKITKKLNLMLISQQQGTDLQLERSRRVEGSLRIPTGIQICGDICPQDLY